MGYAYLRLSVSPAVCLYDCLYEKLLFYCSTFFTKTNFSGSFVIVLLSYMID
jgi:hypothetical protein